MLAIGLVVLALATRIRPVPGSSPSGDAWRWRGLGKSALRVWRLLDQPKKTKELATQLGVTPLGADEITEASGRESGARLRPRRVRGPLRGLDLSAIELFLTRYLFSGDDGAPSSGRSMSPSGGCRDWPRRG